MRARIYKASNEVMAIACEELPDGRVKVTQRTTGEQTEFVYGTESHEIALVFEPTDMYGLEDIEHILDTEEDDLYITDIEDYLEMWGVNHERVTRDDS